MTIEQTQSRAILNWEMLNVGRDTTLQFKQNASDAALNRVVGASAKPSEIHGSIKADGTVLVVNQNGVIFTGTSQVNARNLVAAAATITDEQFRDKGIYTDANGTQPTFRTRWARSSCGRARASPRTNRAAPCAAAVMCCCWAARSATPARSPRHAAGGAGGGRRLYIRKGYGTDGNVKSTTAGNEVGTTIKAGSTAGWCATAG